MVAHFSVSLYTSLIYKPSFRTAKQRNPVMKKRKTGDRGEGGKKIGYIRKINWEAGSVGDGAFSQD